MNSKNLQKFNLPNKPGVYFFFKGKEVLYIGKATSLKNRVKSYFRKDLIENRGPIILDMVFKANKIKWQITGSVLEALILEAGLIKKHQPKYNTKEKSDKSFLSVIITDESLPRVFTVRTHNKEYSNILKNVRISKVYGPFTNGSQLREAMKIIRRIFPFLDGKSKNYIEFYKQINLIPDLDDHKMYLQNIKNIKLFFSGQKQQIFRNLKKEMKKYAKNHEFEKAGEIKRQMFALKHINDVALIKDSFTSFNFLSLRPSPEYRGGTLGKLKIKRGYAFRVEAYDIAHMGGKNMVGVMTVVEDGEVAKHEYKKFKIRTQAGANDTGALKEVLERRLAHTEWPYPDLIVVDGDIAQLNVAGVVLRKMGLKIPVVSVVKDERHKAKAILSSHGKAFLRSFWNLSSGRFQPRSPIPARPFKKLPHAAILLANSEAHRFAIAYHKNMRNKNFLR